MGFIQCSLVLDFVVNLLQLLDNMVVDVLFGFLFFQESFLCQMQDILACRVKQYFARQKTCNLLDVVNRRKELLGLEHGRFTF